MYVSRRGRVNISFKRDMLVPESFNIGRKEDLSIIACRLSDRCINDASKRCHNIKTVRDFLPI